MINRDQNGNKIIRNLKKEGDVWAVNVWIGSGCVTNERRYSYRTKKEAQNGDIGDENSIAVSKYEGEV